MITDKKLINTGFTLKAHAASHNDLNTKVYCQYESNGVNKRKITIRGIEDNSYERGKKKAERLIRILDL